MLGILHWYQLALDHDSELKAVPKKADDAALRLVESVRDRLMRLVDTEDRRPFYHYADFFAPENTRDEGFTLLSSPLVSDPVPDGILAWFTYNLKDAPSGPEADIYCGPPDDGEGYAELYGEMSRAARELAERSSRRGQQFGEMGQIHTVDLPLVAVAVNQSRDMIACVEDCAPHMRDERLPIGYSRFHLRFYREYADGEPRVVATRRVMLSEPLHSMRMRDDMACLGPIADGFGLVQGFFIDPGWLFRRLPAQMARQVLSGSERFLPMEEALLKYRGDEYQSEIWMVRDLGLSTDTPEDDFYGLMKVAIDMGALESHFRSQTWRFLGVAAMLTLSLATGMVLLLRSVSLELEQAGRTENFVAAVTHELRTPLSAIRLHGEMLLEGWAKDEDTRREYHRRILRETNRLSTLVERVLEKSKLASGTTPPAPGELNQPVERLVRELSHRGTADGSDLAVELGENLPRVWLSQEALSGILVNLVENARKYAPPRPGDPTSGPITVRTRADDGDVVLEVADRGPGVPAAERERIFEAFYRAGNERTRTTQGTGLGLHLVKLHAEALGASVSVHDNPGGGALFRIRFRRA